MPARVELSQQAVKDLAELGKQRRRVESLLLALAQEPRSANLDIKALRGRAPWSRVRIGPFRVIFRPLTGKEIRGLGAPGAHGYIAARIIHRRDLERIVGRL